MWENEISKLKKEADSWGVEINDPAKESEIAAFQKAAKEDYDIEIPKEHLDFLRKLNGVMNNGRTIYGIDEKFLEESPKTQVYGLLDSFMDKSIGDKEKWVYLAEDEGFLYAYRVADGTFYQLDDLLFDIRKSYGSYEEMIKEIIEESLK